MRNGAYRILEPLGRGGMGALYLAADSGAFDRECVIKELLDYYGPTDPGEAQKAQARFETEARLLAELSHPGIPRIYSYFSEAGRHYIVMEYIEGETLEQAVTHVDPLGRSVAARPLSAEEVVRHAIRICRVLEYLADQPVPVIHHDVKPANLIVDQNGGEVRLVDFGTARTRTRWATQVRLARGGTTLFGTEGYAAPEQHQGLSDPRSDVYSLAATVYHLLTDDDPGEHPFQFPEMAKLSASLAGALARALRLGVRRRSSATEFRRALEKWLIPEDGAVPFVFRDGAVAHTTSDLVALCDQHWAEARRHLSDGDFDRWYRDRSRHDLVAQAQSARLAPDADAALETFLRGLDPRLPPPQLVVEPQALDFVNVIRRDPGCPGAKETAQRLLVRNEGRGYALTNFSASVPWLSFEPGQAGCRSGERVEVTVQVDATVLPLRREHQAIITCAPARGAPVSIPVMVELGLAREAFWRFLDTVGFMLRLVGSGSRAGFTLWMRTFRSMLGSRIGVRILAVEVFALAAVMVGFWWTWQRQSPDLVVLIWAYLRALPLALVSVYLLPACLLVIGAIIREAASVVLQRIQDKRRRTDSAVGKAGKRAIP
jgi:serine/threonine protein kinase